MQRQSRATREQGHVLGSRVYLCQWPLTSMALVPQGNCHSHVGQWVLTKDHRCLARPAGFCSCHHSQAVSSVSHSKLHYLPFKTG